MKSTIDFTTEMGEGFALPPFGLSLDFWRGMEANGERIHPRQFGKRFDDELMPHVSSASLACGVHSGDPAILGAVAGRLAARSARSRKAPVSACSTSGATARSASTSASSPRSAT